MRKGLFSGKYYKFVSPCGFSFAVIIAYSNEGKSIQLITPHHSYEIEDCGSVKVYDDLLFEFYIHQADIQLLGRITTMQLHPLKTKVMGPFTFIPFMECKHAIYSMYHTLSGEILLGDRKVSFQEGYGYIEGDSGRNFPRKYIWYNSVLPSQTAVTIAIAQIPMLFFRFTGLLCFVKTENSEISMCTWNGGKVIKAENGVVEIKRGKYRINLELEALSGHSLKAPIQGDMRRIIKENLVIPSKYILYYKDQVLLASSDFQSSCEWVDI